MSFRVGRKAQNRNDVVVLFEQRSEVELVVELPLALQRSGVHDFNGDALVVEGGVEDGAEAALAEEAGGGEGVGGAAEDGVGEAVRGPGVGGGGAFLGELLAEAEGEEEEEGEGGGGGGGGDYGGVVVVGVVGGRNQRLGFRDLTRRHGDE